MSRHRLDRAGIDLYHFAGLLGASTAEPAAFRDGDDTSAAYVEFFDASGAEVELEDAAVQDAAASYIPPLRPDPAAEFRKAIEAATSIADLKAALLGTTGPGAEPRRRA
jgi:hypothetical protein